jgi:hypothetical protein
MHRPAVGAEGNTTLREDSREILQTGLARNVEPRQLAQLALNRQREAELVASAEQDRKKSAFSRRGPAQTFYDRGN